MLEEYISLFGQVYWSAVIFHTIALIMGFGVIMMHGKQFKASSPKLFFKSPIEWIYLVTVASTIGNMLIISALYNYIREGHLGYLPSKREFLFAFYHALEGITVMGWHVLSFIILKLYGQKGD